MQRTGKKDIFKTWIWILAGINLFVIISCAAIIFLYQISTAPIGEIVTEELNVLMPTDSEQELKDKVTIAPAANAGTQTNETVSSTGSFSMSNIKQISATSELAESNVVHSAGRLVDGDVSTAWVEGVSGQGIGETVYLYFDNEYSIHGIHLAAGYQKNTEVYNKNSRPAEIRVSFSDGTYEIHVLSDIYDLQDIAFSKEIYTEYISLTIEAVYPGTKYEDTVISEINIY